MTSADQAEIALKHAIVEAEIDGDNSELNRLLATRERSFKRIGVTQAPQGSIVGKRTALTKMGYRKTAVWGKPTQRRLKLI
jgi:hypothetical protein